MKCNGHSTVAVVGPRTWNHLPDDVTFASESLSTFHQ